MPTRHVKKERCIPEEGMPHAHKACQKKEKKKKKIAHIQEKKGGEKGIVQMRSSTIHQTKIIHTLAHPPYLQLHKKMPLGVR